MKKHQEGYVLVYVLVAILVLSALSIGIFSHSLRNLKAQEAAVAYEQDKYAAEGMIEQAVALLKSNPNIDLSSQEIAKDSDTFVPVKSEDGSLLLTATSGSVQVIAEITVSGTTVTYNSYTITSVTPDEGGNDE